MTENNVTDHTDHTENKELKGLGGWLILVAIGLVANAAILAVATFPLLNILSSDMWAFLIEYQPEVFNRRMWWGLWGLIAANAVLLSAFLYLIYLFFKKHYLFPRSFIIIQVIAFIILLPYSYVASFLDPSDPSPVFDAGLFRSALMTMIWIAYMLKSKRVQLTFVEHRPTVSTSN